MGIQVGVVDGERFFREGMIDVLEAAGFACQAAEDGDGGLALGMDPAFGVLLLDLGADGIEVLRRIRAQRPMLQVLVLAGADEEETLLEALRLGARDYLAKPLHDEELVLAVGRACETYAVLAEAEDLRVRLVRVAAVSEELSRPLARTAADPGDELCKAAAELLQAGRTSVLLLPQASGSADVGTLRVVSAFGFSESLEELDAVSIGQGVAGQVAVSGEAVLVESRARDERFPAQSPTDRDASDSFVCVPVFGRDPSYPAGDEPVLGVVCASEPVGRERFAPEDLAILRLLAGRVGNAFVESERTLAGVGTGVVDLDHAAADGASRTGEPDRDAELMRGICDALANEVEPERVLQAVLESIEYQLAARPVSLYLRDAASGDLVCEGQRDGGARADHKSLPGNRGLTGTALQAGNLVATDSPELDARYDPDIDTPEDGLPGPLLCVPIRLRGKVVGLCRVFLPAGEGASSRTGEALAAGLSAAVRNVLLYRSLVESIEEVAEARREARP